MGVQRVTKRHYLGKQYSRTQGVDIHHRDSAIRRLSVTEGCDCGVNRRDCVEAVGCQSSEWMVAVTGQQDETGGGGGLDQITVETIGNHLCV